MTSLYFGKTSRLKSYGATTKGEKTIIKIEVEVTDHYEAAGILNDLKAAQAVQKVRRTKKPLQLTYQPGELL